MARALAVLAAVLGTLALAAAAGLVSAIVDVGPVLRGGLVTVGLVLAGAAVVLWRRRPAIGGGELALVAVSLVVALGALEGAVRLRDRITDPYGNATIRLDDSLGWTLREGWEGTLRGGARFTSTTDGLRARINPGAPRRVLVLGDSYTHAAAVSDDSAYWAHLGRAHRDVELTVMGVGGYGTLQQLQWLRRLKPRARPALVLVQLASNDLLNNDFALERASLWNNNAMRRAYLEGDSTPYRDPARTGLADRSALARIVAGHVRILRSERLGARTIEQELPGMPAEQARAVVVSRRLLEMLRDAAAPVPVVAFLADDDYPAPLMTEAARQAGIPLLPVTAALARARAAGVELLASPQDKHWSAAAHAVVAAALDSVIATVR